MGILCSQTGNHSFPGSLVHTACCACRAARETRALEENPGSLLIRRCFSRILWWWWGGRWAPAQPCSCAAHNKLQIGRNKLGDAPSAADPAKGAPGEGSPRASRWSGWFPAGCEQGRCAALSSAFPFFFLTFVAMGRVHRSFLPGARIYACSNCRAHLTNHEDIVSKSFQGRTGRAYLFNTVINVTLGPVEDRNLTTGLHKVRAIGRRKLRCMRLVSVGLACDCRGARLIRARCSEQAASVDFVLPLRRMIMRFG